MIPRILLATAALCAASSAQVRSGKAVTDLLAVSTTYQTGPIQAAIRMKLDPGWHTYWSNPGEGGMKISVKWTLPPGWTASEPAHPVPKSFNTGGLAGYGYEGTVLFPVTLTPPPNASGEMKASAKVSWLTCNDDSCVPGSAVLDLSLSPGPSAPTADAERIKSVHSSLPRPLEGLVLTVVEKDKSLLLTLTAAPDSKIDPAGAKVFPETPQAVDPASKITFSKTGDAWTATVPKNEYATGPLKTLTLVIAGAGQPTTVTWTSENP